jgi:O-antigen/teichoic acid export membrane protein
MEVLRKIRHFPLIVNSGIASLDQALLSLANLLISIIFIKYASKAEYGYYSIAYSIILFVTSIQNAVVNTPLAVLLVTKKATDKKYYVASLFYGQFLVILPCACLFIAVAAWLYFMGFAETQALVVTAACFAGVGLLGLRRNPGTGCHRGLFCGSWVVVP